MKAVKVNIFISHAPEDKKHLDKLLQWLYPMQDEVNLWYNSPPPAPPQLSLPWQILLFWYQAPDNRRRYRKVLEARRERAHIYIFLTSFRSLASKQVDADIDVAAQRKINGDNILGPHIYPLILSPSLWKTEARISGFKPLAGGTPLSKYKQEDEGYLAVTEELAALIKVMQSRLGEAKFYRGRKVDSDHAALKDGEKATVYLGESDEALGFENIAPIEPPEWLGWAILLFIFISVISTLTPERILGPSRYDNVRKANEFGPEYPRQYPLMPPKDSLLFPPKAE